MKQLLIFSLLFSTLCLYGQINSSPILFIYDGSGSMWGEIDGGIKKEIASQVLSETISNLPREQAIGLMAYGHRKKGDCDDIEILAGLDNMSRDNIISEVNGINPIGKTPLASSVVKAFSLIDELNSKATVILITDGIESCDGELCASVKNAKAQGIEFKLHIVGFGLTSEDRAELICASQAGDGQYFDAGNAEGLSEVLSIATVQTVDVPSDNFTLFTFKNGEPVDAWVKARDLANNKDVGGVRTYRDTASLYLPKGKYTITVNALENSDLGSQSFVLDVTVDESIHRDVSFDSGKLNFSIFNNDVLDDATIRAYKPGESRSVASTRTYGREKELELDPGIYNINVLILQVKGAHVEHTFSDVKVEASSKQTLSHVFESGQVSVGIQSVNGELIDATINFYDLESGKNVDAGRSYTSKSSNPRLFVLSPGQYEVKVKTLGKHKGHQQSFEFELKAGQRIEKLFSF